ncbi:MAG: hypothetical protein AB1782_01515, partial [Cyanobacteriota bacterium]
NLISNELSLFNFLLINFIPPGLYIIMFSKHFITLNIYLLHFIFCYPIYGSNFEDLIILTFIVGSIVFTVHLIYIISKTLYLRLKQYYKTQKE